MSSGDLRGWLRRGCEDLVLAFALLTRLPLPSISIRSEVKLSDYVWAFPIVGFIVGLIGALVLFLARVNGVSPNLTALMAMAVTVLATGALHEDGLADFCDGIGGGQTRERKLDIMRDSSIGSYGAVALFLGLAARWAALSALTDPRAAAGALVLSHTLGRGLLAIIITLWRPARTDGLAAGAADGNVYSAGASILLSVFAAITFGGSTFGLAALALGALAVLTTGAVAVRYLGGYTGDVFGAAEQLAEVAVLTALCTLTLPIR